jgi:hypothetical protein
VEHWASATIVVGQDAGEKNIEGLGEALDAFVLVCSGANYRTDNWTT